jgi:hypothetical protein
LDKAPILKHSLALLSLIVLGSVAWWLPAELSFIAQASQQAPQALATPGVGPTSIPATPPLPAKPTTPTPALAWAQAPACENIPQDLATWLLYLQQHLSDPAIVAELNNYLRQAQSLDPAFQSLNFEDLLARLSTTETAESSQVILRELTVLWLNIISGRLNQATELDIPTQPDIKTVGDLVAQLEHALVEGNLSSLLLEASQQLQTGQNINRHVCSRLIYRTGSVIRESLWSAGGYLERDTPILNVPAGITSFSPDYTKLIVETPASDAGGGPLYLFDLKTGELLNLNQKLGLDDYQGPLGLTISGWSPDSSHFLIFDQNDGAIIWADLEADTYQRVDLNREADFAPLRHIALTPTGYSFIYIVDGPNREVIIRRYDLESQTVTPLTRLNLGSDQLKSFRLSPTGEMAALVIKKGQRQSGLSYALELLNMATYTRTILIEGNLGRTEPVWSPDGQKIAFSRKTVDAPDVAGVEQGQPWQGNIWVASIDTGDIQQITFVDGAAFQPAWSADSRFLAFITHTAEIGLVAVDQPGLIWRMGTSLALPQLTSLNFVP